MPSALSNDRWRRLADAGLVQGDPPADAATAVSWTIAAMVGAAAWLAALFLLFFLGLALEDVVKRPAGAIAIGLVVIAASIVVLRRSGAPLFVTQLALAFSLAGQALVLVGLLMNDARPDALSWSLFAMLELGLIALAAHPGHRVLATFGAAFSLSMALHTTSMASLFLPLLLAAFVAVQSRVLAAAPPQSLWTSVATGLALGLLAAMIVAALPELWTQPKPSSWQAELRIASAALLVVACAFAALLLVGDAGHRVGSRVGIGAVLALGGVAIAASPVPAVAAALVMLLMAFAAGQRALLGFAAIALVAALAHHYYRLDATLLQKSAGLAAIAAISLGARFAMLRRYRDQR
jgi:Domain of unknown function (DUF4401)